MQDSRFFKKSKKKNPDALKVVNWFSTLTTLYTCIYIIYGDFLL